MAEPKVTAGGVVLGKVTVARKHARRGQDLEKKPRHSIPTTKDNQVDIISSASVIQSSIAMYKMI